MANKLSHLDARGKRWIVEDAEQDQRVTGVAIAEERAREAERERDPFHQAMAEPRRRREVIEHRGT